MSIRKAFRRLAPMALLLLLGAADAGGGPRYTPAGDFIPPPDYREWVFMSSGLGMSYSDKAMAGGSMFDNVFVDPAAWASFKQTGHWPDKSMFALETRGANSKGSINKQGQYQTTELMGVEFHVRDEARFKGGWGFFFGANGHAPAKLIPYEAPCYACHQAHAAVDTTFTQFYPTAKPIAAAKGTYLER